MYNLFSRDSEKTINCFWGINPIYNLFSRFLSRRSVFEELYDK